MHASSDRPVAHRILEDLTPVRRLARPLERALPAAGIGLLMAAVVYLRLGVRHDAGALGRSVLWGLSGLQMAYGVFLVVIALRTAVPGRALARRSVAALLLGGAGIMLAITWLTWFTHASRVPAGSEARYFATCFRTPVLLGLPALILTVVLAFRAYPTRPVTTGALAGLGAGLLSDGSWRTFCEVSAPGHVLSSHFASVALLTVCGIAIASVAARWNRFRTSAAGPR
jgi:hypothetical protein